MRANETTAKTIRLAPFFLSRGGPNSDVAPLAFQQSFLPPKMIKVQVTHVYKLDVVVGGGSLAGRART